MEKIPIKAKNLKVIDYKGSLYATLNGTTIWKIDKVAFNILKLCDGKRSFNKIVEYVAEKISHRKEDVEPIVKEVLDELERMKFIEWV